MGAHQAHLLGQKGITIEPLHSELGLLECYCQDGTGPLLELTLELTNQGKCVLCVHPFCGDLLGL